MCENILITVIIVIKNANKTLPRALESLNQQDDLDFCVIVKDYSDDHRTRDLVFSILHNIQRSKIKYIAQPDCGIYDALNQAICHIDDGYVAILHSDDSYPRDAIAKMKSSILDSKADIIYGINRHVTRKQQDHCLVRNSHHSLSKDSMTTIEHTSSIIHRRCFRILGLYATNYKIASDYEFFLRSYLHGLNFHPCDYILCNHTQGGLSQTRTHLARAEMLQIKRKYHIINPYNHLILIVVSKIESIARTFFRLISKTRHLL